MDFHLTDAPNWRSPRSSQSPSNGSTTNPGAKALNVYGVAQPTLSGIRGVLSLLGCRPEEPQLGGMSTPALNGEGNNRRVSMSAGMGRGGSGEGGGAGAGGMTVWLCLREEPISEISNLLLLACPVECDLNTGVMRFVSNDQLPAVRIEGQLSPEDYLHHF